MKKILILSILAITFWFSNSKSYAQRSYEMELLNLIQINETEFRFDVRFRNTAADPVTNFIAIEGMQFQVAFNTAILNGGGFNNSYLQYIPSTSDFDPSATKIVPASSNVTSDQLIIQWITQPLSADDYTAYINHNNWVKVGTFKVILKANSTSGFSKNYASVLPDLSLIPSGCLVNWCNVNFDLFGDGKYTRASGAAPNFIANKNLINSIINKPLYSYAYTGSGLYSNTANWNISVDPSDASFNVLPSSGANISIGKLSTANPPINIPAVCTLDVNKQVNDLTIKSTSSLTMEQGTQLSVNGTLYNDNATAGSLTLKANATGTGTMPTASLKNNTPGVNATIECNIPAWSSNVGWHLLSSPVASQAIAPVFIDPTPANYDFYNWDAAAELWRNQKEVANNMTAFVPGNGYLASYFSASTHNFVGTMNTGDVTKSLTYSPTAYGKMSLLGNPYSCAILGDLLTKTNVNNTVYVLDGVSNNYKTWNGTTGDLTNGEIPALQGFWVEANAASPSVTIHASSKIHSATNLLKTTLNDHLRLNVQSPNATKGITYIYFKEDNSNGVDASDATFMKGINPLNTQIYSYINNNPYAINALETYSTPVIVNLGFEPNVNGEFKITAEDIQSFAAASHIFLQDTKTNITQDLRINPVYSFTADTIDNVKRFTLYFDLDVTGINNASAEVGNIYSFENNIYIKTTDKINLVSVYNMLGQEVETIKNAVSNVLSIHQKSGYYTVRVITENNVYSQKVYIK